MSIREKALSALALLAVVCAPNAASTTPRLPVATDKAAANNEVKVIDETILIPYSQAATPSAEFGNALSKARSDKENHSGKSPSFSSGAYGDHFTWGADAGSSIDMSATDMSTIDLNINVGYKGPYVRFLGIGAGISTMVDNSSRFYPLYAMFRSSFSPRPRFCFLDLRAGVAFCNLLDQPNQTDFYGSLGLGITLAHGRRFSSHIIAAYTFIPLQGEARHHIGDLHFATLRLGISF